MTTSQDTVKKLHDGNISSSVFDSPCPSVASDKPDVVIVLDEEKADDGESDIEIDEESTNSVSQQRNAARLSHSLPLKLDPYTEVIIVKPNLPVRVCRTAVAYANLQDIHIIAVLNPQLPKPECVTKRQVYISEPYDAPKIYSRSRVFHRPTSQLGFVLETPCATQNNHRYLVLYDNFTASYHSHTELHLCLCQDFRRHLLNIDYKDLRAHYQHVFQSVDRCLPTAYPLDRLLRVRKFGAQFHNVRVVDIDHALIKVCFYERKSKKELWIHSNSLIIERSQAVPQPIVVAIPDDPPTPSEELPSPDVDHEPPRLRKRKNDENYSNKRADKRLRDRSNVKQRATSPDENSRNHLVTTYYTNILLPKFRALNILPATVHKCNQQCVLSAEQAFCPKAIRANPFLLPFEYHWSVVESKPRGYRTPCRRTLFSLEEIEQYLYQTQSKLSIKYFIDGVLTRFKPPIDNYDKQFLILDDLSNGQENVQVSVYNDVDNGAPEKFTYITGIRPIDSRIAAALNDTNTTSCCNCTDNCSDRAKCACFRKTLHQAEVNHDTLVMDKRKNHQTYAHMLKTTGYQRKRLMNPISSGLYECNSKCACHRQHCSNRLVQQGLFVHLQLFKDKDKGWGLRTLHDLPRGTFICQYIGELLTSDQGHERAQTMDDKYQTSLDLVKQVRYEVNNEDGDDDDDDDDDSEPFVVDGSLYSNLGKYFNHSCDPNMFIQNVFIESHDLHFPNLALFTRTHIKAGQAHRLSFKISLTPNSFTLATSVLLPPRENPTRLSNKSALYASIAILPNASLSSSQSTDESCASAAPQPDPANNKLQLFRRMLSLRSSASGKSPSYRSYHLRAFEASHDHYSILVHFLDDTERAFQVDRRCKGSDLLNEIFDFLDLTAERKYFGLLIEDLSQDFAYRWLDANKLLKKQLAANLSSHNLYFKVRFFVNHPAADIDDEFTKYLYVLQLRKELLSGKIWCPRTVAISLASYIVQSELGDYDSCEHRQGYLKDFRFVPFQNVDFENEVQLCHEQHRGQSPADAESNYLRVASSLDMYGVELHKASVKVSNGNDSNCNSIVDLYVGVSAAGIAVFQNSTKINTFAWDQITKISFKRRTFYVQLVKSSDLSDDNSVVFTLRSYRCCKYLWKSCVDHHTFFRLTSTPSSPKKLFLFTSKPRNNVEESSSSPPTENSLKKPKSFERISSRMNMRSNGSAVANYENVPLSKASSLSAVPVKVLDKPSPPPPKPPRVAVKTAFSNATFIEANDYKPKNALSPSEKSAGSIRIKLTPDADGRYGFNVKGGENEQTATVVSKVVASTPASRASLREGDIILAVNNTDIRHHSHAEITEMIRHSRERPLGELELLIKPAEVKNSLQQSLQILRNDLSSKQSIEQYDALQRRKDGFTFEISSNQTNYYRNRYKDVLPYDQTRVILKTHADSDYINASYINMPIISTDTVNRYIATQGPLPTTCEAFWRMIWEQKCSLIIMLTTLFESGRIKCHQYWPNAHETADYGSFTIRCTRERKENDLMYRELIFVNKDLGEERVVYQIQNEIWPDHGVPTDYASFVDFILEIRELRKANKHLPILVHCSAGIGRTGVLILVETALCLIENRQPVFPLNIVRQMREQRLGMIQTAGQYQFACEAILHAYDQGLIEVNGS